MIRIKRDWLHRHGVPLKDTRYLPRRGLIVSGEGTLPSGLSLEGDVVFAAGSTLYVRGEAWLMVSGRLHLLGVIVDEPPEPVADR